MKMRSILFIGIAGLLSACSTINYVGIETYNPAEVTFPENVAKVLIVNNAVPQPEDAGYEYTLQGEKQDTCKAKADSALFDACRTLGEAIVEASYFNDVLLYHDAVRKDNQAFLDEISVAVRMGGPNPASNSKLADLIAKAKRMSVPNDNIQRIIKKAEGGDKTEYEAITYEGYGPGGVAVMVETLTDNRNRTAADLRHYFDKNGGNLGAMGCVAFLFSQKGVIDISLEDKDADEAMMDALDAGAEDFDASEDAAEITTDPENYSAVVKALEEKGYEILSDDLAMVPMTTTRLTDPDQLKAMGKLLDALEENDDVQNVWHSLENEEDLPE